MNNSVLYILMRKDLPSMNAGKAMAQASHASNAFVFKVKSKDLLRKVRWTNTTEQGFGTVLVLAVDKNELKEAVSLAIQKGYDADLVYDPTYPYRVNPEVAQLIPQETDTALRIVSGDNMTLFRNELTCGYIFGDKDEDTKDIVSKFPLHP